MANPYIVSSYVQGNYFYDRAELFSAFENTQNRMVWLKGNRQVGKTSFLWKLYADNSLRKKYLPIYIDFGACESLVHWTECLGDALSYAQKYDEDARDIIKNLPDLPGYDFFELQRLLVEQINQHGLSLLLLCDEAEAWNTTMEKEPRLIQRLRKEWDALGNIHVLIAATDRLSRLMKTDSLQNSPLLPRLYPIYIAQFSDTAADALIQQTQNPDGIVKVSPENQRYIKQLTGNHPYLVQSLCSKLYQENGRCLRPVDENDLIVDDYLDRFFQVDFSGLSDDESIILFAIAKTETAKRLPLDQDIQQLTGLPRTTVNSLLLNLMRLGLVNQYKSGYAINNFFFHTWLLVKQSNNLIALHHNRIINGGNESFENENNHISTPNLISILHLSDIHLSDPSMAEIYRVQLETDLSKELNINKLDYLLISGDIADKAIQSEYKSAAGLVKGIQKRYGIDSQHIIVVPGNHDINWDSSEAAYNNFVFKSKLPTNIQEDKCIPERDGFLIRIEDSYNKRLSNFNEYFYNSVINNNYPLDYKDQGIVHYFSTHELMILALNSSWQIDHYYKERSGINPDALAFALDATTNPKYKNWLKMAIWHHPVGGKEMMEDSFLQLLSVHGFKICFHGHIHEASDTFYKYDNKRGLHIIGAGTFGSSSKGQVPGIPLQYNLILLDRSNKKIVVNTRKKEKSNGAWAADARWGDPNQPKPSYEIELK